MQSDSMQIIGVLSDKEIIKRLEDPKENFCIAPFLHRDSQITGCKVDLHLSGVFYEVKKSTVEVYDPIIWESKHDYRRKLVYPIGKSYTLHPGTFALAETFENICLPKNLLGILEGRSSLGRLGVIIHATACFIDPNYKGSITLEISNLGELPVNLYALSRVATLSFLTVAGGVKYPYGSSIPYPKSMKDAKSKESFKQKYDSIISQPSKFHEDWEHEVIKFYRKSDSH